MKTKKAPRRSSTTPRMQQLLVTGVPLQWKADTLATFVQRQLGKRHSRGGRGFSLKNHAHTFTFTFTST
jgi:hypothetical protein